MARSKRREVATAAAPPETVNASDEVARHSRGAHVGTVNVKPTGVQHHQSPTTAEATTQQRITDSLFFSPPSATDWTRTATKGDDVGAAASKSSHAKGADPSGGNEQARRAYWVASFDEGDDAGDLYEPYDTLINGSRARAGKESWVSRFLCCCCFKCFPCCGSWCPFALGYEPLQQQRRQRRGNGSNGSASSPASTTIPLARLSWERWGVLIVSILLLLLSAVHLTLYLVLKQKEPLPELPLYPSDAASSESSNSNANTSYDRTGTHRSDNTFVLMFLGQHMSLARALLLGGGVPIGTLGLVGIFSATRVSKPLNGCFGLLALVCGTVAVISAVFLVSSVPSTALARLETLWEDVMQSSEQLVCDIESQLHCSGYRVCCITNSTPMDALSSADVWERVCFITAANGTMFTRMGRNVTEMVARQCPQTCGTSEPAAASSTSSGSSVNDTSIRSVSDAITSMNRTGSTSSSSSGDSDDEEDGKGPLPQRCAVPIRRRVRIALIGVFVTTGIIAMLCALALTMTIYSFYDRPMLIHELVSYT